VKTASRLHHVAYHQANQQCQRGDNFKIEQCLAANPAHPFQIVHAGNPAHDRAEDDGRNQHCDQPYEAVAQRLHGNRIFRSEPAEQDRGRNGDGHLKPELCIEMPLPLR
jgi:hypothetical protein